MPSTEVVCRDTQPALMQADPSIFFSFDSVVIVGASDDHYRIGGATLFLLKKYGYDKAVYGLNPKYTEVQGIPCFPTVEDLPQAVDVAVFCVSADNVKKLLPQFQKKGLKGAVIYSAGFGESGAEGKAMQRWLSDFSRTHNIALLGPNCVGQASFAHKRALTFTSSLIESPLAPAGRIALLSQSGGVATNIMADGLFCGLRFSHMITTGNEAALGLSDYIRFLAQDPETDVVLGYIEGLRDGAAFCAAAREMQLARKPMIMMRVGTSVVGQDAVSSHTGQLSSDDSGYQAAFEKYGIIRAHTLQDLNDYARLFSLPKMTPNLTVVTTSGGAGVYVADLCDELQIELTRLSPPSEGALSKIIPSYGRVRNPVDLTAQVVNDMSILEHSMKILLDDPNTGILLFLLSGKGTYDQSEAIISLFTKLQAETTKGIIICWLGVAESVRVRGLDAGLIIYPDPARFLRPLSSYFKFYASGAAASTTELPIDIEPKHDDLTISSLLDDSGQDSKARSLSEKKSMACLEQFGVDLPERWYARNDLDLSNIAKKTRYPCVLKLVEPMLNHKSDSGGVVVNITSEHQLQEAWKDMQKKLGATEVMIAEQIEKGVEVLVGCMRDDTFGLRLTIGAGGIWTNFIQDAVTLIPPFTDAEIRRKLQALALWGALSGSRGQATLAIDALIHTILGIAKFAMTAHNELSEFECNPVIVTSDRAVVVDALGFAGPKEP